MAQSLVGKRRLQISRISKIFNTLVLAILFACGWVLQPAAKESATTLIAEKIEEKYGNGVPTRGYFAIRFGKEPTSGGEYITEFWMDKKTGRFIANLVTETGEIERVWGLATLMVSVPVPIRNLAPDALIFERDVVFEPFPYARLGSYTLIDYENIVGMQVRRMLIAGKPISKNSVQQPKIISRGEKVRISLRNGGLELTAKGKAISDAYLGQSVRVVNLSSKKTISAVARAAGLVVVEQ